MALNRRKHASYHPIPKHTRAAQSEIQIDIHLHPRQHQAFESIATELFYGGAAGGGKSFLMRAAAIVWCLSISNLQVYLFRRVREDVIKGHLEGVHGFRNLLKPFTHPPAPLRPLVEIVGDEIRFLRTGAKIYLCHCKDEDDRYKYLSADIHVLLIDELTTFTEVIYRFLRSRVRAPGLNVPPSMAGMFPRIIAASNPGNVGHHWVKATFIDGCQPMELRRMSPDEGGMLRQFISAKLQDNPSITLESGYANQLAGLGSPELVKAMLNGDWNVVAGAFFSSSWDTTRHVVPAFFPPAHWTRLLGFDWGSARPYAALWAAVSDGAPVGDVWFPKGALVVYRELYGAAKRDGKFVPNQGLQQTAEQAAIAIVVAQGKDKTNRRFADPACWKNDGGPSIAERMAKRPYGLVFEPADNSRIPGWNQIRARLEGDPPLTADERSTPMLYICENCTEVIRTLPALQYDTSRVEDVDSDGEDHAPDALRYICMSRPYTRSVHDPHAPIRGLSGMTMDELWKWQQQRNSSRSRREPRI